VSHMLRSRELRSMQEDYRSGARSNVRPLTRTRAGLPGNQIGGCSPRTAAASGLRDEVSPDPTKRWPAVEDDVQERMEAGGLSIDGPVSDLQGAHRRIGFVQDTFGGQCPGAVARGHHRNASSYMSEISNRSYWAFAAR
jgi:hypothetical protein